MSTEHSGIKLGADTNALNADVVRVIRQTRDMNDVFVQNYQVDPDIRWQVCMYCVTVLSLCVVNINV